jgi:hypothetical protein
VIENKNRTASQGSETAMCKTGDQNTAKYQVNLDSVLDCQVDSFDHGVVFEAFGEAKEYALDAFESVIERLTELCEQIKAAESFEKLDLGWWEPLFEMITQEGGSRGEQPQSSREINGSFAVATVVEDDGYDKDWVAYCPKSADHRTFETTTVVNLVVLVDEQGDYISTVYDCSQIVSGPDTDNLWNCSECGEEARWRQA